MLARRRRQVAETREPGHFVGPNAARRHPHIAAARAEIVEPGRRPVRKDLNRANDAIALSRLDEHLVGRGASSNDHLRARLFRKKGLSKGRP